MSTAIAHQPQAQPQASSQRTLSQALKDVAMVVDVSCTALGMSSLDKRATNEINAQKHATSDAGRVLNKRLPGADHLHKRITGLHAEVRNTTHEMTMVWGKRRLLPNAECQRWVNFYYLKLAEHNALELELAANVDDIIATAERNKGDYETRIPTRDELVGAYSMSYTLEPLPDISHVTGNFDPAMNKWLQDQYELSTQAAYTQAQRDIMERVMAPCKRVVERMKAVDERQRAITNGQDPGKAGRLYDTVLTDIQDIAKVFASFNLTGDPIIKEIAEALHHFDHLDTKALKEDGPTRDEAARQAEEIIRKAQGWMGI